MKRGSYTLPKEGPKNIEITSHTLSSVDISIFTPEISNFGYIKKFRYRLHCNT